MESRRKAAKQEEVGKEPASERSRLLCQVAFLASEGMTQKEIAAVLRISQSTVSVLLQKAMVPSLNGRRLLDPRPRFVGSAEELQTAQNSLYLGDLEEKLTELGAILGWKFIPKVHIGLVEPSERSWDERVVQWAKATAPAVAELLDPCHIVAVSWGRQIRALVDNIPPRNGRHRTVVVPLWPPRLSVVPEYGDTLFRDHVSMGTNSLTRDLTALLNGPAAVLEAAHYFLPGVDLIPFGDPPFEIGPPPYSRTVRDALARERKFVQQFKDTLRLIPAYRMIFGAGDLRSKGALVRRCDAMIISLGPSGTPRSFDVGAEYGGVPRSWLASNTAGDLGGVLLPREDGQSLSADEVSYRKQQFERLRNRWTGAEESDIDYVARHGKVGTIACGVGKERGFITMLALRKQLIRHLCCDLELAHELTNLVTRELAALRRNRR